MSNFGYALAQGLAGVADKGMGMLAEERQMQMKLAAEEVAANRQLKNQERLEAVREMAKNRAAEAFGKQYQGTAGMQVQKEAAPVTEFTAEGVKESGYQDGMQGDAKKLVGQMKSVLVNPSATDEQKEHAQAILAQLGEQFTGQKAANAKAVEGQSRDATMNERVQAAVGKSLESGDSGAAVYGSGLLNELTKDERELAKAEALYKREELKQEGQDRRAAVAADARQYAADQHLQAAITRIEKAGAGKANDPYKYISELGKEQRSNNTLINTRRRELIAARKSDDKELVDSITAEIADLEKANRQLGLEKRDFARENGIKVPEEVTEQPKAEPAKPAAQRMDALPAGAKQIGTKNGKPVYELPNGKRFIQE